MQVEYSNFYQFPGNYKWNEFYTSGVYILLTDRRQETQGQQVRTVFTPFYVGQSGQIGPEILRQLNPASSNACLRWYSQNKQGNLYIVYASIKEENVRRAVEAFLIRNYIQRGFKLCNTQTPIPPSGFTVNVF